MIFPEKIILIFCGWNVFGMEGFIIIQCVTGAVKTSVHREQCERFPEVATMEKNLQLITGNRAQNYDPWADLKQR